MTTFTAIQQAADHARDNLSDILDKFTAPDGTDVASLLADVRDARIALQNLERDLETATAKAMLDNNAETPTLRIERQRPATRTAWSHPELQAEIRRKVIQSLGLKGAHIISADGEELSLSFEETIRTAQELHGLAAPRTGALRKLGIDPDDYCQRTQGPWRVTVTRLHDEAATDALRKELVGDDRD